MTIDGGAQQFAIVFRGFDPAQVESALTAARKAAATAREDSARAAGQASAAASERDDLRRRLEQLESEREALRVKLSEEQARASEAVARAESAQAQAHAQAPAEVDTSTFVHLGKRIGQILSLAEAEAASMLTKASNDADRIRADAGDEAERVRRGAEQYAAETRERADTDSEQLMIEARESSGTIVDDAVRDAAARREEAEAYYERQRAHASAAAADFEHTLGQRREHAAREFQGQIAAQEEELKRVVDRVETLRSEGEQERASAAEEAVHRLAEAKEQAHEMVETARIQAERIRRESERELAAAMARRDSITSQLSNVRTMLATFGVGVGVGDELLGELSTSGEAGYEEAGYEGTDTEDGRPLGEIAQESPEGQVGDGQASAEGAPGAEHAVDESVQPQDGHAEAAQPEAVQEPEPAGQR